MRFMMIVKASKDSEAGMMPGEELLTAMGKYNEELMKAGVLLDALGLQPSSKGARVKFSKGKRTVTDGPFAETRELIGGYWIIQVNSKEKRSSGPNALLRLMAKTRTAKSKSAKYSSSRISLPAKPSTAGAS